MRSNRLLIASLLLSLGLLTACSGGGKDSFFITKQWHDWTIKLETRPHPIRAGFNEFLVHVVGSNRRLPRGMMVHYRLSPKDGWIQAMPDGLSDIFRRALTVKDPAHAKLYVRLQYQGKEGLLVFDFSKQHHG